MAIKLSNNNDDTTIVQRARRLIKEFNRHLAKKCPHCESFMFDVYPEAKENLEKLEKKKHGKNIFTNRLKLKY